MRREAATAAGPPDGPRESALDRAWKLDSAFNLSSRITGRIAAWTFPTMVHQITVSVQGGPHADIKRVWYLACSALFGKLRNTFRMGERGSGLNFITYELAGVWDITTKTCQVEVAFATTELDALRFAVDDPVPAEGPVLAVVDGFAIRGTINPTTRPVNYIKRGPEQLTVGASWPNWMTSNAPTVATTPDVWAGARCTAFGGLFTSTTPTVTAAPRYLGAGGDIFREYPIVAGNGLFGFYPYAVIARGDGSAVERGIDLSGRRGEFDLPDTNRVITTAEKDNPRVQPPGPTLDGYSRSNLLGLVAQSLQTPCFLPSPVPCTPTPNGDPGVYVGPRGTPLGPINLGQALAGRRSLVGGDVLPGRTADGRPQTFATPVPPPDFR